MSHLKNYEDRGRCYPSAEAENSLGDSKAEFNDYFIIHSK